MKKNRIIVLLILTILLINQSSQFNMTNNDYNQIINKPEAAYTVSFEDFHLSNSRGNSFLDYEVHVGLDSMYEDNIDQQITGIYFEIDDGADDYAYVHSVLDGLQVNDDWGEGELYGYSDIGTNYTVQNGDFTITGTTEQYIIPNVWEAWGMSQDGGEDGGGYNSLFINHTEGDGVLTGENSLELIDMTFALRPLFNLISKDNIYTETNTYLEMYNNQTEIWTEFQSHEGVIMYYPEYKLRLFDKETDVMIFEDTIVQNFTYSRDIEIASIKMYNYASEPIVFKLDGATPLDIQISPFESISVFNDAYTSYTVEDLYTNVVDNGGSISATDELIYIPGYYDDVYLKYIDQDELNIDFNNFRTEIDFGDGYIPVLNQLFLAERNNTIDIKVYNMDYELITNDSLYISSGLNFKNITIPLIYIENNSDEQIIAYVFNQSSVPTDFYTYSYLNSDYESYENDSYIESFESNTFKDTTISFENNSNDCPFISVVYDNQVNINENNTFNIYPIETVNDINIVKIWNNITLINETLSESLGYYTKTFNSSYSHYYSVEIYIEDILGYYQIMKIDDIFVLKNQVRINLENLQNKYVQYSFINVSADLYEFDGTQISGSVNFTLKYPNATIILEDESPNLEYQFGYICDYYTLIIEYLGDLDNLACSIETIFEVIPTNGQSYQPIYFDEDSIFNLTISPYSIKFHNMTAFTNEVLFVIYFDIYNNELYSEVFNFSSTNNLDYIPDMLKQCRIILTDQFNHLLEFENYHIYVNSESILSNLFYRTIDSTLNISVYDLFGNLLYEDDYIVEREDNFIDLIIEQYSLKILNQLYSSSIINITNLINPLEFILSEYIALDELLSLYVKEGDYQIYYIDDSDEEHTLSFNVNESKLIMLNTTYHEVHFAYFDLSGLGLESETARFYINDIRRDIGRNWIQGDNCSIDVLDYFNETIYSESISLVDITEFNIYLPVYTMLINNNFSTSMEISIQREGNGIEFRQIIPAQYGFPIRLMANIRYGIHMYYTNGTLAESKSILLTDNYQDISFGVYETKGVLLEFNTITIVDLILTGVVVVATSGYLYKKNGKKLKLKEAEKNKKPERKDNVFESETLFT